MVKLIVFVFGYIVASLLDRIRGAESAEQRQARLEVDRNRVAASRYQLLLKCLLIVIELCMCGISG